MTRRTGIDRSEVLQMEAWKTSIVLRKNVARRSWTGSVNGRFFLFCAAKDTICLSLHNPKPLQWYVFLSIIEWPSGMTIAQQHFCRPWFTRRVRPSNVHGVPCTYKHKRLLRLSLDPLTSAQNAGRVHCEARVATV